MGRNAGVADLVELDVYRVRSFVPLPPAFPPEGNSKVNTWHPGREQIDDMDNRSGEGFLVVEGSFSEPEIDEARVMQHDRFEIPDAAGHSTSEI